LSGRGKLNGLSGPIKEAVAVFLFQLADLRAHRRLRPEYFFSSAGKAALSGNFQKRDKLIEVHWIEREL
jgi:hypothetical protein